VASCGEKTGVFRVKDIQKVLETNMCSFVKREIIASYFCALRTKTGGKRYCLRLQNAGLEIRIQKIAIRKKGQLEHSGCIWALYGNITVRWEDISC